MRYHRDNRNVNLSLGRVLSPEPAGDRVHLRLRGWPPHRSRTRSLRGRLAIPGADFGCLAVSVGWPREMIVRTNAGGVRPRNWAISGRTDSIAHPIPAPSPRVRGNEDALGRTTFVVGVPLGVVAARRDGYRNRGAGDALGERGELGQPSEVATLAHDNEGPGLAVHRTAGPTGHLEDRLEIAFRDGLVSELADLARPAQRGQDDIGSGTVECT
jgi:hypothetical protein